MTASNIKLVVAYDGTNYLGWQKTNMGASIEESLQKVLEQILQEPIVLQAASRTDAGVHAKGQVVNFITHKQKLNLERLPISINCLIDSDIVVLSAAQMPLEFHPTLQCVGKEYWYQMSYAHAQLPHYRFYSWLYPQELNVELMRDAAALLIGKHDFSAFCNELKNAEYTDYIRQVTSIIIEEQEDKRLLFRIKGNNFLYKMVRNLVGTIVYVGCGKLKLEDIPLILTSGDRKLAGMTAPAHGLSLEKVYY